jgi:hypothetical protein
VLRRQNRVRLRQPIVHGPHPYARFIARMRRIGPGGIAIRARLLDGNVVRSRKFKILEQ